MRGLVRSSLRMNPTGSSSRCAAARRRPLIGPGTPGHPGGVATYDCSSAHAALGKLEEYVAGGCRMTNGEGSPEAVTWWRSLSAPPIAGYSVSCCW